MADLSTQIAAFFFVPGAARGADPSRGSFDA
jgi:hypothetical protein